MCGRRAAVVKHGHVIRTPSNRRPARAFRHALRYERRDTTPPLPFVLDPSNVDFALRATLAALAVLFKGMKLLARRMFLVGGGAQVYRVFSVSRLDDVIPIRNTLVDVLTEVGHRRHDREA